MEVAAAAMTVRASTATARAAAMHRRRFVELRAARVEEDRLEERAEREKRAERAGGTEGEEGEEREKREERAQVSKL